MSNLDKSKRYKESVIEAATKISATWSPADKKVALAYDDTNGNGYWIPYLGTGAGLVLVDVPTEVTKQM